MSEDSWKTNCFVCWLIISIILIIDGSLTLSNYWTPIDGLHAAKCSLLSIQDHGSTECRYCEE